MNELFQESISGPVIKQNGFSDHTDIYDEKLIKLKELFDLEISTAADYEEKKKKIFMTYKHRNVFYLSA